MPWDSVRQDLVYSLRGFRREKGFFAAAILIIAIAIGANTAIFSTVHTLLVRPLDFAEPERLVWIENNGRESDLSSRTTRVANYLEWREMNQSFEDMTAYFAFFDYGTYNLVGAGEPERLVGVGVAQNFLPFLGIQPQMGRNFNEEEAKWNGPKSVILTHGLWVRRFGADPGVLGRSINLNNESFLVVGILPASFDFSSVFSPGAPVDMLTPFPLTPETNRWGNTLAVMGRLKPGVSLNQAQAEFTLLSRQILDNRRDGWRFGADMKMLQERLTGGFGRGLLLLLAAVGAVLLIACTNLSNLLLARAASRQKEVAVRFALGATRGRVVRQLLTESLLVSFSGALLGLVFAWIAISFLTSLQGVSIPLLATVKLDRYALAFTALIAVGTGLFFGLVPAFQSSRGHTSEALKETGRSSESRQTAWIRQTLVVSEVALACILLVGAGLLIRSFGRLLEVDLGFQPEKAAVWRIETGGRYADDAARNAFFDRLVRTVEAVPGVASAGLTDAIPLSRDRSWGMGAKGVTYPPGQYPLGHPRLIDHRYLKTMAIAFIEGRDFNEQDTAASEPVIILNEKAAKLLWPDRSAVGQQINSGGPGKDARVVGVVRNVRHRSLEQEGGLEMYFPLAQRGNSSVELVVRTKLSPESLAPSIRAAFASVDPALPTAKFQGLTDLVDRVVSPRRLLMMLLGGFAVAALLLASIGIYGVISYSVRRRTQEIGIRMALGASPDLVRRQVMMETLRLVSVGIAIGLGGALVLSRLIRALLFEMEPSDPLTYGVTLVCVLAVAAIAGFVPALRASRVHPSSSLRVG